MKKTLLLIVIIFGSIVLVKAQDQCLQSVNANSTTVLTDEQKKRIEECRGRGRFNNRVDALRNNGKQKYIRDRYKNGRIYVNKIRPLYRGNLTTQEKAIVEPSQADVEKYASFLKKKNTGLTKLLIDQGCDGGTEVVVAKTECEKFTMPGAGASFSFRANRYSIKRLADISFMGKYFDTDGAIKHGILVNIGDKPLNKISLKTKELAPLVGFKPITKYKDASIVSTSLIKGAKAGNLIFGSWIKVEENKTYALRSVAYKTPMAKRIEDITYDEFDFDERDDVIIVFRVIHLNAGKDVTILWKRLKKKRAPKMRMPKKYQEI